MSTNESAAVTDTPTSAPKKRQTLTRAKFAAIVVKDDRPFDYIDCPEWDCTVKIIAMTGDEAVEFARYAKEAKKNSGGETTEMFRIIAASVVDEDGNRVFDDPNVLRGRSLSVLNRLQDAALKLNGYKVDKVAEGK